MSCSPRWRNAGPHDLEPAPAPHTAPRRRGPRRRRCGVVPELRAGRAARDHRARPRLRHQALLHGAAPLGSRGLGLVWRRAHRDRRVSSLRQRGAHPLGNDEYRWVRRLLGYGLGGVTSFERLKHNAHWLSDTVAGAALGAASAHFAMKRANALDEQAQLRLVPIERGAMLSYTLTLR